MAVKNRKMMQPKIEHKCPVVKTKQDNSSAIGALYSKGVSGHLFADEIKQFNQDKLNKKTCQSQAKKLLATTVGKNLFCLLAKNANAPKRLQLTKTEFAALYAHCSLDEFNKCWRRAQIEIDHYGDIDDVGTFNNAILDALHKVETDFGEDAQETIWDLADTKLKRGRYLEVTAKWIVKEAQRFCDDKRDAKNITVEELLKAEIERFKEQNELNVGEVKKLRRCLVSGGKQLKQLIDNQA